MHRDTQSLLTVQTTHTRSLQTWMIAIRLIGSLWSMSSEELTSTMSPINCPSWAQSIMQWSMKRCQQYSMSWLSSAGRRNIRRVTEVDRLYQSSLTRWKWIGITTCNSARRSDAPKTVKDSKRITQRIGINTNIEMYSYGSPQQLKVNSIASRIRRCILMMTTTRMETNRQFSSTYHRVRVPHNIVPSSSKVKKEVECKLR